MERPSWAPLGIDLSVPSVARIYNYYLGGSYNFEVDREAARRAMGIVPGLPKVMQANRSFMRRAVRHAAGEGITQFLDIGSGIPDFGNVHEVARAATPQARIVYVDNDPVAVAHSRAVLEGSEDVKVAAADLRRPREILDSPEVGALLDLDRPVALLLVSVLHFLTEGDEPHRVVAELRDALAPGSLLVMTHASAEDAAMTAEQGSGVEGVYRTASSPLVLRSRSQVERFFDGFDLLDPGVVVLPHWRPDAPLEQEDPAAFTGLAGVGRKP